MNTELQILYNAIADAINNEKVVRVEVYTFNFDPTFFENYIMPLFVSADKEFTNNEIHNLLLWRSLKKDSGLPPITVYCDFFAKSATKGPKLDYNVFPIKTPAKPNAITNFHPKLLLIETDKNVITCTGSGNVTPSGWCNNIECFSIKKEPKNKFGNKAGNAINKLQSYFPISQNYTCSINESFKKCVKKLSQKYGINKIEVIAPYHSNNSELIDFLHIDCQIKTVHCLLPKTRHNEVTVSEEAFNSTLNNQALWCNFNNTELNKANRNLHAKAYRLYGQNKTITIIGSHNFTKPAWRKFNEENNEANIELSTIKIEYHKQNNWLKPIRNIYEKQFTFIASSSLEDDPPLEDTIINRNAPEFTFTVNWKTKTFTLACPHRFSPKQYVFSDPYFGEKTFVTRKKQHLSNDILKSIAKTGIIKVKCTTTNAVFTYYILNEEIGNKPLPFKLTANNILKFWRFEIKHSLNFDDHLMELINRHYNDDMTVKKEVAIERSILNEQAQHFVYLTNLEKHLFVENLPYEEDWTKKYNLIKYYLTTLEFDTLPTYIEQLLTKDEGTTHAIDNDFSWFTLQLINKNFYQTARKWRFKDKRSVRKDWPDFIRRLKEKQAEIKQLIGEIELEQINEQQKKWLIKRL